MIKRTAKQEAAIKKARAMTGSWDDYMQESLSNPDYAKVYLEVAIEEFQNDGDMEAFLLSLGYLARAKGGMAKVARKTGLSRESLYRTLSKRGNPQFRTILGIIDALGMRIRIETAGGKA